MGATPLRERDWLVLASDGIDDLGDQSLRARLAASKTPEDFCAQIGNPAIRTPDDRTVLACEMGAILWR